MKPYSSTSGKKSGVTAFELGDNYITVQFHSARYKYSYNSSGQSTTETMKQLASLSSGLSTFIAQNRPVYEWKK